MTDFDDWVTRVTSQPGPGEERLDQLRGSGIDGLTDAEAAAWLLQAAVDYQIQPGGCRTRVIAGYTGRTGPECAWSVPDSECFPETVFAVMDRVQVLADVTRRPVKVIHVVDGKPELFLPTLGKSAPDLAATVTSPVWELIPRSLSR